MRGLYGMWDIKETRLSDDSMVYDVVGTVEHKAFAVTTISIITIHAASVSEALRVRAFLNEFVDGNLSIDTEVRTMSHPRRSAT